MILTEKNKQYQHYHQVNCEDILPSNQSQLMEKAKFTYSPLE